jgi:mRNA interferase MazF
MMKPGDVVLIELPQISGEPPKLRPALVLALLPEVYQGVLICGISTQLHSLEPNWDDTIGAGDADYAASGLRRASAIRLSYLYSAHRREIRGVIGSVDALRLARVRQRLARVFA